MKWRSKEIYRSGSAVPYGNETDKEEGNEALMKERHVQPHNLKITAIICMTVVILFILTACGTQSVFDGSRTSNASEFLMEYRTLNREESADLDLSAGDRLQVSLSHTKGSVDMTVGMAGKDPIYRGTQQQNAAFILEIAETGKYHISISGHQAKGDVSFIRIPGGQD